MSFRPLDNPRGPKPEAVGRKVGGAAQLLMICEAAKLLAAVFTWVRPVAGLGFVTS